MLALRAARRAAAACRAGAPRGLAAAAPPAAADEPSNRPTPALDLSSPHLWYPEARALRRHIIYHSGPTNSGKTYTALAALRAAKTGLYAGPLRLLAAEVYEELNAAGTLCSLVTGQERREVPGAGHVACTVEMADARRRVEVAVLDEVQLLADASRGWAWTRALLGLRADAVHVAGDPSAVGLVAALAARAGDSFEERRYARFAPLTVQAGGLEGGAAGWAGVAPGDCVVAFSRRDIFAIKAGVEAATPHRAAVVYGALPPETRRQQARLFNDPDSDYKVMVASDAVGLGLNLNIRRVVFHTLVKTGGRGREPEPVSPPALRQLAGRAGRRSSAFAAGVATCRLEADVGALAAALAAPPGAAGAPAAGLLPEFEHLELFAAGRPPGEPLAELIDAFAAQARLGGRFFFCRQEAVRAAAALLGRVRGAPQLSLRDAYAFCVAPASASNLRVAAALLHFARRYAAGGPVPLEIPLDPARVPATPEEMRELETAHAVVDLWLWLALRFEGAGAGGAFPGRERAEALAARLCELLGAGLERITAEVKAASPAASPPRAGEDNSTPPLMRLPRAGDAGAAARDAEPPRPPPGAVDWGLLAAFGAELEELMAARREEAEAERAEREDRGAVGAPPDEEAWRAGGARRARGGGKAKRAGGKRR